MPSGVTSREMDLEFDPFSREMMWDPYPKYRQLREHAPVYYNKTRGFWSVVRLAEARLVMGDNERFASRGGGALDGTTANPDFFGTMAVIGLDRPEHSTMRRQMNPKWRPPEVAKLEAKVTEIAEAQIDSFIEAGETDIAKSFGWAVPNQLISWMMDVPESDRPWVLERFAVAKARNDGEPGLPEDAIVAAREMKGYFSDLLTERRERPGDDLLTSLGEMDGMHGGRIPIDDAAGIAVMFYFGGTLTSASLISNSLWLLVDEPDVRRRIATDPDVGPQAIEELLRIESPIASAGRRVLEDVELGGHRIEAGEKIGVFIGSANRDELVWGETSEELDIDRPRVRPLVFGEGIHFCIGAHLARLEGRIALRSVLSRIPEYEIVGPLERTDRVNERGVTSLPVRFG
jgi:cytochrome P450